MGTKSTTPSHSGAGVVGDGALLGSGVGALKGTELPGAKDGVADGRAVAALGGDAVGVSVVSAIGSGLTVGTAVGVDDGVKLTSGSVHPTHVLTQRARIDGIEQPPCSWNTRQSRYGMALDTSSHKDGDASGANVVVADGMPVGRSVGSPVGSTDGSIVGSD